MKLKRLSITNFQKIERFDEDISGVCGIFGFNEAGKSSIADAIRFAVLRSPGRAENIKHLGMLVHEGAKEGAVSVSLTDGERDLELNRTVSTGKLAGAEPNFPQAIHHCFDGSIFARELNPIERRAFLFSLMGLKVGPDEIKSRLLKRGIDGGLVDRIMPLLAGGTFAAALTDAERRRVENKAAWHEVTGEVYGGKKAEGWIAPAPAFNQTELDGLKKDIDGWQAEVDRLNVKRGELDAVKKRHDQLPDLRKQALQHATIADRIKTGLAEYEELQVALSALPLPAEDKRDPEPPMRSAPANPIPPPAEMTCPACMAKVMLKGGILLHYKLPETPAPAAAAPPAAKRINKADAQRQRDEYAAQRQKVTACSSRLESDKRQLAQADGAANLVSQIEAQPFDEIAYQRIQAELADAKVQVGLANTDRDAMLNVQRQHKDASKKTARASELHVEVKRWDDLCGALSPNGIPAEILGEALGPLSTLLKESAKTTGWRLVEISPEMAITYGGRPYQLQSESAKWRVDAMLAVAIARISRVGVVILDRVDCLDLPGRDAAINWMQDAIYFKELESVVLLGTLKSAPVIEGVTVHWIGEKA